MSEKEMNSYRFVSGQEPSDEMLSQLMSEVAAKKREMGRTYKSRRKWLR